jgi:hypothetical protein
MIDAVLLFGVLNVAFEFVLVSMMPPRWRLRMLGNAAARNTLHTIFLCANLIIHWGTLIGTMSAVLAFIASMITVRIAQLLYGQVIGHQYHVGLIRYDIGELA